MTDDEMDVRRQLGDLAEKIGRIEARVEESGQKTDRIDRDLYDTNGSGETFMRRMKNMERTIDRVSWLARIATWLSFIVSLAVVAGRVAWQWITSRQG